MPKIYPQSLAIGPGKRVGTAVTANGVTAPAPNMIRGLARNDRSLPFSSSTVPTTLYFDIFGANRTTTQTFNHVYLLTENVATIDIGTGRGGSTTNVGLYTPGPNTGLRLSNGAGRVANTNRNVWKLAVTGEGTFAQITINTRESNSGAFYVYACYFLQEPLLILQNDDKTSFASYRATSNPRTGIMQEDLYGTSTYQQSVNRSEKRQVNFTVWRVDHELVLIDRWIDSIIRAREQYPNIFLDEEFLTGSGNTIVAQYSADGTSNWHSDLRSTDMYVRFSITTDSYSIDAESNDPENFYPATWSAGITDQIEGNGAKSIGFQFQQS